MTIKSKLARKIDQLLELRRKYVATKSPYLMEQVLKVNREIRALKNKSKGTQVKMGI